MFRLFKKKTELEKLEIEYKKLLELAFKMSTTNRTLSDQLTAQANSMLDKIEVIKSKQRFQEYEIDKRSELYGMTNLAVFPSLSLRI